MTVDLRDLPRVREADVYKAARLAGRLRREIDHVEFRYDDGYLASGGLPVATTLPLTGEPVRSPAGAVPPFFAGLLPEGRRLTALRQAVKTSADDELSLLLAVGHDTVGDVQVALVGEPVVEAEPLVSVGSWDEVRFSDLFARSVGGARPVDLAGIAGVQEKVSGAMLALPVGYRAERYVLKLDPPEFPHLVENERFFLQAARDSGVPAAEAELVVDAEGRSGLLVTRFDRLVVDGGVRGLAQEDGCQVLGRYPADKYALSAEEVVGALAAVARARPVAARELVRQIVFAYVSGNGDAHAKNLSVFQDPGGEWRASPAYDLPSSYPYGDDSMALSIQGRRREDITRRVVVAFGDAVGVPPRATERVIDEVCDAAPLWLERLGELPFDERRIHRLRRFVQYRRDRLAPASS